METYCSENITKLAQALIAVQKEMTPASRDGTNPFTRSNYATLNSVMESCRDILLAHGIWLTQLPVPAPLELGPGHIALLTKLTHAESGQWQSSLTVIPLPKADPQGMGSAITYGRRYALTAMLGMITEDDDGEAAKLPPKTRSRSNPGVNGNTPQHTGKRPARPEDEAVFHSDDLPFDDPSLPRLEGVTYQHVTAQDGRPCIIATGNTLPKKEILSGAGFRWHARRKYWWKFADAA